MEIIYPRCAAIDGGKREIAVAVRAPGDTPGRRRHRIRKFKTFYQVLSEMVAWLLVNARHINNVPGRKTDVEDSSRLARLLECGLQRGSFIRPKDIAAIRELTRYRTKLIEPRTRELQRLSKVLEDGGIKIDSVASSITTLSARDMSEALIVGERDPHVLTELARGVMRNKIPELTTACAGRFGDHHALLARPHTDHIDHLAVMIEDLDGRVEEMVGSFAEQIRLLRSVPGIGRRRTGDRL